MNFVISTQRWVYFFDRDEILAPKLWVWQTLLGMLGSKQNEPMVPVFDAGHEVDAFVVEALLRRGSRADVYRALHKESASVVALKVLNRDIRLDRNQGDRFFLEAQILGHLNHPGVPSLLGAGSYDGDRAYLALSWVDGEALSEKLRGTKKLKHAQVHQLLFELLDILESLHRIGVVHRNIAPENLWIRASDGACVLLDFGLAKNLNQKSVFQPVVTHVGVRLGDAPFMSPEQRIGDSISVASDIYSLGALAYFLYSGERAFGGISHEEWLKRQRKGHIPSVRATKLGKKLPKSVDAALRLCLSGKPSERPSVRSLHALWMSEFEIQPKT